MNHEEIVLEILSSPECDNWVFNAGQQQGSMHKEEIRRGFEGRERHVTSLLGVELSERLQDIYSQGFDVGVNGWPKIEAREPGAITYSEKSSVSTVLDINDI